MLYYDLIEYYKKERNEYNEIVLISKTVDRKYTFRRYTEMFTGRFLWANVTEGVSEGYIFTTDQILKYFDLPVVNIYGKYRELKTGTIIQVKNKTGIVEYYKKTDNDTFIECNVNGYIKEPERYTLNGIFETFETVKVFNDEVCDD